MRKLEIGNKDREPLKQEMIYIGIPVEIGTENCDVFDICTTYAHQFVS